jgi:hypothetical protein
MKNINKINKYLILASMLVLGFASCKKDDNGDANNNAGKGAPTITSVRTVSKSTVDSSRTNTYTTYNSAGVATTTTTPNYNPVITALDSTTTTGKLGNYYAIMGTNLGSTTQIFVNDLSVLFNRALSSDNTVIFSIPSNTPYVQPQSNTIKIVTLNGTATYGFTVLPPAPSVTSASDYNFTSGTQITLTGSGLSFVTGIKLQNTNDALTIVSKTDAQMVVKMPATTVSRAVLSFTYTSGTNALHTASSQEFVSLDNNYQVFANGAFQNAWADASWQAPSGASATAPSVSGKGSAVATYPAGGWKVEGFANWSPGFDYSPSYKFLTFWIKGGVAAHKLTLVGDQMDGGYGQNTAANAFVITVPATVWTYFKIPLVAPSTSTSASNPTSLNFWKGGTTAKQLGFFLKGVSGDVNETLYIDELMFVK